MPLFVRRSVLVYVVSSTSDGRPSALPHGSIVYGEVPRQNAACAYWLRNLITSRWRRSRKAGAPRREVPRWDDVATHVLRSTWDKITPPPSASSLRDGDIILRIFISPQTWQQHSTSQTTNFNQSISVHVNVLTLNFLQPYKLAVF